MFGQETALTNTPETPPEPENLLENHTSGCRNCQRDCSHCIFYGHFNLGACLAWIAGVKTGQEIAYLV